MEELEQALGELKRRLRSGESLRLLCRCHPRRCHAHYIARWLASRAPAEQHSTADRRHGCSAVGSDDELAQECQESDDEMYVQYERNYGEP